MDYLFNNSKIYVNLISVMPSFRCFIQALEVISTAEKKFCNASCFLHSKHFIVLINTKRVSTFYLNNEYPQEPTCNY